MLCVVEPITQVVHARRFQWGLGMTLVAKSDQSTGTLHSIYCIYIYLSESVSLVHIFTPYWCNVFMHTGNHKYASYVLKSGELIFTFTSAYSKADEVLSVEPLPHDRAQS